jgi:hypothetical protein
VRHATPQATQRVVAFTTSIAWLLFLLPFMNSPTLADDPLFVLVFASVTIMAVVWIWSIYKVEQSLNVEGESLFYPWRVPSMRRKIRRIDGVIATSIRRLVSGEDEEAVLATPHLHVREELRGEARRWYDLAMDSLEEAAGRDWVFDAKRRQRALEEAEGCLWAARAEYLREMIA